MAAGTADGGALAGVSARADIAVNGAFLTRRWEKPENWMRLTREVGFPAHSFCSDVLDPFFSGGESFLHEQADRVREAAARYEVTICDYYTGVATHRFHGLSHSDEQARNRMYQWILEAAGLAVRMGTCRLGGHWDAFSCETLAEPSQTEATLQRLVETFRDLADALAPTGLRCLMQEQMYIPSEKPWTLVECERFLASVNTTRERQLPVLVTLDVGHQAGMHYGLSGEDLDYAEWVRRFGATCEVIHLQQTTPDASHHWPFTEQYNRRGHVDVEKVLEALSWSHRHYDELPVSRVLPKADFHWLVAEIIPGSTRTETELLNELAESSRYLRSFVPEGGLVI